MKSKKNKLQTESINNPGSIPSNNWITTTIGDIIGKDGGHIKTGPFGTVLKAHEYSTHGVPIISVGEIRYGTIKINDSTPRAPIEVVKRLPTFLLKEGDIVFARKGSVDRSAFIRFEQNGWFLGSDGIRLRLPKTCDSQFIAYQLQTPMIRNWFLHHATGSTMLSLNQKIIERIPIVLPSLLEQQKIAKILNIMDKNIELKLQMIKLPEIIGNIIFKKWFIDYDFSNKKIIYNDELKKYIPIGWDVENYGKLLTFEKGIEPGSKNYLTESNENSIKFYRVREMADNSICKTFVEQSLIKNTISEYEDILVFFDGTVGRVQTGIIGSYSSGIRKVYSKDNYFSKPFIYFLMKSETIQQILWESSTGSIILHAGSSLKNMIDVIPEKKLLDEFSKISLPLFRQIIQCKREIETLSQIKDSLLPKLMSGEIRV